MSMRSSSTFVLRSVALIVSSLSCTGFLKEISSTTRASLLIIATSAGSVISILPSLKADISKDKTFLLTGETDCLRITSFLLYDLFYEKGGLYTYTSRDGVWRKTWEFTPVTAIKVLPGDAYWSPF